MIRTKSESWSQIRQRGDFRFLVDRGICQNKLSIGVYPLMFFAVLSYWFGIRSWRDLGLMISLALCGKLFIAARFVSDAYLVWKQRERDYLSKQTFKRGGAILNINNEKKRK